jgi:glutathione S-transferase
MISSSTNVIRLYSYPDSSNALKPRLVLEEAGVPYETIHVDIRNGQSRTPEFQRTVNPFGVVPVLEVDGIRMFESTAIIRYLARRFLPALYPPDDLLRCQRIDMWIDLLTTPSGHRARVYPYENSHLGLQGGGHHPWHDSPPLPPDEADGYRNKTVEWLALCEQVHAGSPWCTEEFSIADIAWACSLERARRRLDLLTTPKLQAWADALLARPSFVRAWIRR